MKNGAQAKRSPSFREAVRQLKEQQHRTEYRACRVCGDFLTYHGKTCSRCEASLEEDRMRRELEGF